MDGEWEAEAVIALEESAISAPRFTDPTIDQAYHLEFHQLKRTHDINCIAVNLALILLPTLWMDLDYIIGLPLIHLCLTTLFHLFVFHQAARGSKWYLERRSEVVGGLLVFFMVSYYFCIVFEPMFEKYISPTVMPDNFIGRLRFFAYFPAICCQISFSHVTPLRSKRNVLLLTLLVCFLINYRRCGQEIIMEPSSSEVYSSILGTMDRLSCGWIPFCIGRFSDSIHIPINDTTQQFHGKEACMAVHGGIQLAFGYILPLTVLGAEEIISRKAFGARRGLKFSRHLPFISLVQQLAMALLQVAVGFQAVVVVVRIFLNLFP